MCGNPFGNLSQLARMIAPDVSVPTAQPRAVVSPPMTCPRCHAPVNPGYEWCPHCGASLHATTCAYCGRSINAALDDCPSCGAPVMGRATV